MKLSKLDFVDRKRYKRGVEMDVNNQLLTVALKKGQAVNYPLMGKEIDKAGYLAMEWFLLNQGKLMSRPFKAKKPNKK